MSGTFKSVIGRNAKWYTDNQAFIQGEKSTQALTYGELHNRVNQIANSLLDLGIEKGDRIAFLCQPTVDHAVSYLAAQTIGTIPASIHTQEGSETIQHLMEEIRPGIVFFDPDYVKKVENTASKENDREFVALNRYGEPPAFADEFTNLYHSYSAEAPDTDIRPEDTAFITFTSGTTGTPKPIPHTHKDIIESAHLIQYVLRANDQDSMLNMFTPSFISWGNVLYPLLNIGAKTVFLQEWDSETVAETIEQERITILGLISSQYKQLLQIIEDYDLSSIRLAAYGGEPPGENTLNNIQDRICDSFFTLYGSSEVFASGSAISPHQVTPKRLESIGRPLPNVDLRIIKPDSKDPEAELEQGQVGEIIIRGPSVATEVWEDRERTEQTFHEDGWWFSGDLARVGDDRFIYLEGRSDNMIISGGVNIYAESVESVIETHPDIVESGVVGVPHEKWGEAVKAYIVTSADSVSESELNEWCRNNQSMADHERPKFWETVTELPRTNTGKLDRATLRTQNDID